MRSVELHVYYSSKFFFPNIFTLKALVLRAFDFEVCLGVILSELVFAEALLKKCF